MGIKLHLGLLKRVRQDPRERILDFSAERQSRIGCQRGFTSGIWSVRVATSTVVLVELSFSLPLDALDNFSSLTTTVLLVDVVSRNA